MLGLGSLNYKIPKVLVLTLARDSYYYINFYLKAFKNEN